MSPSGRAFFPNPQLSRPCVFSWLLCVAFIVWWPLSATECIFSFHFLSLESPSKTMDNRPSQAFLHALFLYRIPAPSLLLLSVGCCVVSANDGRLKLMPCPSLYFFVTLFAASNDRKKSSQRVPPRSHLITNTPPPTSASADLRLVVVTIDKTADLCSTLPQFFDKIHFFVLL